MTTKHEELIQILTEINDYARGSNNKTYTYNSVQIQNLVSKATELLNTKHGS